MVTRAAFERDRPGPAPLGLGPRKNLCFSLAPFCLLTLLLFLPACARSTHPGPPPVVHSAQPTPPVLATTVNGPPPTPSTSPPALYAPTPLRSVAQSSLSLGPGWAIHRAGVYHESYQFKTNSLPHSFVAWKPPSTNLPPEVRRAMMLFLVRSSLRVDTVTNRVFDHFLPESLNNLVWTNLIAHTNGRSTRIWTVRTHPPGWPTNAPIVKWNHDCLMWGMKGMTAISPCWELEGASGQVPITLLTRRHGYARGHSMGVDGFRTKYFGKKVWFLAPDDTLIERRIVRDVCRTYGVSRRDYTVLLFDRDLPDSIQPMRVVSPSEILGVPPARYARCPGAPAPVFKTEQTGHVSADVPGFTVNTFKGGDSGSPNMLPMPGELLFYSGRSTSGPSPELQADMDALCRMERLDPKKYQLQWADLSAFPAY